MDFRMEKSSWFMILFMIATMAYFIMAGAGSGLGTLGYLQVALYAILCTSDSILLFC
jgi:hypothetical protein